MKWKGLTAPVPWNSEQVLSVGTVRPLIKYKPVKFYRGSDTPLNLRLLLLKHEIKIIGLPLSPGFVT